MASKRTSGDAADWTAPTPFTPPNADPAAWQARLPGLIARCERRWSLSVGPPFPDLSYAFVAPAVRADGTAAVLKLAVPEPELTSQIAALRAYAGRGAVRLLHADAAHGALVLERLTPGTPLTALADDDPLEATRVAAGVMRSLWRPPPSDARAFPTVARWAAGLAHLRQACGGGTGPLPPRLVDAAERWFADLVPTMDAPVLLHGDLHPGNILRAARAPWLAIDPKGVLGEPAYEVGALLRNLAPAELASPRPDRAVARRADVLTAELGLDRRRMLGWSLAQAVLAAWWCVEDGGPGFERFVACADAIAGALHEGQA